jgi:hypothetical protein
MKQKRIHTRALTSFFVTTGFLVMAITGIILFLEPEGRIAYWVHWEFLGLTKTQWGNIHIVSSLLFIVAGIFHIYFNWKPLINYIINKVAGGLKLKKELAIAGVVSLCIIVGSIFAVPPLKYILDFNEFVKDSWVTKPEYEPPFGHAELMSMRSLARIKQIDLEKAVKALQEEGYTIERTDESLETIAETNDTSPMAIYQVMIRFQAEKEPPPAGKYTVEDVDDLFAGSGVGRLTISDACQKAGVDLSTVKQRLTENEIEYQEDETLKDIAEGNGIYPLDLLKIMLVEGYTVN